MSVRKQDIFTGRVPAVNQYPGAPGPGTGPCATGTGPFAPKNSFK
jgi:hypothetical protein